MSVAVKSSSLTLILRYCYKQTLVWKF